MIYACWSVVFCERLSVDSIVGLCLHHTHALALWNCCPTVGHFRYRPGGLPRRTDAHCGDPRGHRPSVDFVLLPRRHLRHHHCGTVPRAAPEHFAARGHHCCDDGASAATCSSGASTCPGSSGPGPSSGLSWACGRRST